MISHKDLKGVVFDIKRYAIHDGPGIRTTVFLKGCPLSCQWCHNPESILPQPEPAIRFSRCTLCGRCIEVCPENAISKNEDHVRTDFDKCIRCGKCVEVCPASAREIIGKEMSAEEVMAEVRRDILFYDESGGGVTFSGGEPLMQSEFLTAILEKCRNDNIHTAVDTTCYADESLVLEIAEKADLFLCDIKHIDPKKHLQFTGVDNKLILSNIKKLSETAEVIIRIPVIPGFNDDIDNLKATAEWICGLEKPCPVNFLPYNSGGTEKVKRLAHKMRIIVSKRPDDGQLRKSVELYENQFGLKAIIDG
ncbi:MAG: glycyl-radical enzyme activating protein [Sedimentisphaerales bacterium]|nr:glycyl-radical enzyme activating protein [Sedimentisphaerales bacterium]